MNDNKYYYAIHFDESVSQEMINDSYSQMLEFAYPTDKTEVYLNDYAKIIMSHNVTAQVRRYFQTQLNNESFTEAMNIASVFVLRSKITISYV